MPRPPSLIAPWSPGLTCRLAAQVSYAALGLAAMGRGMSQGLAFVNPLAGLSLSASSVSARLGQPKRL